MADGKAFDFKAAAEAATTLSPLMDGKNKLSVDDVIRDYPQGVTITDFDMLTDNAKGTQFCVCLCKERPDSFFFGGSILSKICNEWVKGFAGDIEACSNALHDAGGVKVQLSHGRTRNGNSLTLVKVL